MFKRAGALASIPLVLAIGASMALTVGTASAQPSKQATIVRDSACQYTVTFTWNGMGHGSNLKVWIILYAREGNNSHTVDFASANPVSGRSGELQHTFAVTDEPFQFQYQAYGYLQPSKGGEISKSIAFSDISPVTETCP